MAKAEIFGTIQMLRYDIQNFDEISENLLTRLKTVKIVAKVYYSIIRHKLMVHTELVPYCQRYPVANTSIFEPVRKFQEN